MNSHYIKLFYDLKIDAPTLVETGTNTGQGAEAWSRVFKQVHTIELSMDLYHFCCSNYNLPNVTFINGASTDVLPDVVRKIDTSYALFLDAHGSGGDTTYDERVGRYGSPVLQELDCVKGNRPSWIIIDDLSDFDSIATYPKRNQIFAKVAELGDYDWTIYKSNEIYKGMLVFKLK